MSEWDKAKAYLVFYAKDDSVIERRDIRNQLKDVVEEGDKLQEENKQLKESNKTWERAFQNTLSDRDKYLKKLEAIRKIVNMWRAYEFKKDPEIRIEIQQITKELLGVLGDGV